MSTSVTTSPAAGGPGTRLSRSQSQQLPALLEFFSPSAALLETRPQGSARGVIWCVAGLFVCCTTAAALIPIDRVVTAPGKVIATESTIVVQPLESSILRKMFVREGQVVHKGDLLAQLDPTFTTADKTALADQVASLHAEVERLRAETAGVDYHPSVNDAPAQVQLAIFDQRKAERAFRLENYRQKIDGLLASLQKAMGDVQSFTERLQVASTVESKRSELAKLGVGSQLNLLQATDQRLSMQAGLQQSQQAAKSAAGDLAAMRAEAAAYDQDWHAKVSQDLSDQSRKLDEVQGNLTKAQLRSQLVNLSAEQDSVVFSVAPVSVGSVLQSGDQLIKLVPLNAPLEVEGSVAGADAGFVHVGDKVTLKFDTFPFTQYGSAEGTVRVISPDSFTQNQPPDQMVRGNQQAGQFQAPQAGQSFYRIKMSIDAVKLHDTPPGFQVSQGMPVTADVMVGKRTVLQYLFSRVLPTAMSGMREP